MDYNFLNVLDQTSNTPPELETNQPNFKEYEDQIVGLTLSETMEGKQPSIDFLAPDSFKDKGLGAVYAFCLDSYEKHGRVSKMEILATLFNNKQEAGDILNNLIIQGTIIPKQIVKSCALEIDDYDKRNEAIKVLKGKIAALEVCKSLSEATKELDDMSVQLAQLSYRQVENTIFDHEAALKDFETAFYEESKPVVTTGLKALDDAIIGLGQGELIILAGRPGMGKTALAIHMAASAAEAGNNVLNFSLEMMNIQNMARFVSRDFFKDRGYSLSYKKIMEVMNQRDKTNNIYRQAFDVAKKCNKRIMHNYNGSITADGIVNFSERHAQGLQRKGQRLDLIVVDYLQIINMNNKRDAHLEIGEVTGKLKQLAKRLSVPVVLLSQLNRGTETDKKNIEDKKPSLNHLRQSGKIEEDADKVIFPFRPAYYERNKEPIQREWLDTYMEIIVAKNRVGNGGIVKASAQMATNYFCDIDQEDTGKTGNIVSSPNKGI